MPIRFANNLQSAIADVGGLPIDTMSFSLTSGDGAKLLARVPDLNTDGVFIMARIKNAAGQRETIKISSVSGDVCTIQTRAVDEEDVQVAWVQYDIVHFVVTACGLYQLGQAETVSENTADIATNAAAISANSSSISSIQTDLGNVSGRLLSSQTLTGNSEVTFTGLQAGKRYRLEFELNPDTLDDSLIVIRFGNTGGIDTGSSYYHAGLGTPQTWFTIHDQSIDYSGSVIGHVDFSIPATDNAAALLYGTAYAFDTNDVNRFAGKYDGASAIDRIQLRLSDQGDVTGAIRLIRIN